jgi:hypothetical protein
MPRGSGPINGFAPRLKDEEPTPAIVPSRARNGAEGATPGDFRRMMRYRRPDDGTLMVDRDPPLLSVRREPTGAGRAEDGLKSARRIAHIPRIASTQAEAYGDRARHCRAVNAQSKAASWA